MLGVILGDGCCSFGDEEFRAGRSSSIRLSCVDFVLLTKK